MRTRLPLILIALAATAPAAVRAQGVAIADPSSTTSSPADVRAGPHRTPPAATLAPAELPGSFSSAPPAAAPQRRHGTGRLVLGGVAGAGVGLMAGMYLGAALDQRDDDCKDMCFGPGMLLGALGGEALGMALGVHLANGRQGNLGKNFLASAAILTAGVLATHESGGLIVAVPVGQLAGTIAVERSAVPPPQ